MTTQEFRAELERLMRASEGMDPATALAILEEVTEPIRGAVTTQRIDRETEALKKHYNKNTATDRTRSNR